jgi:hypothetical protein
VRIVTLLLALALGAGSAGLVACGGKANPHLLSAGRADRVTRALDEVRAAVDSHDCATATKALRRLQDQIAGLPNDTDPKLRQRLDEGAAALADRVPLDCRQTETTPPVTETVAPTQTETATTQTQTQTTATETTPTTETTTTPTTTTTTPTTTETVPGNGGATPTTP